MINPDVNSQGQIDEDGESEERAEVSSDVNDAPAPDADETPEEDDSPEVHSAAIAHNGMHTDVNVRIFSPTGWQNKRIVIPGRLTARKLGDAIAKVASW